MLVLTAPRYCDCRGNISICQVIDFHGYPGFSSAFHVFIFLLPPRSHFIKCICRPTQIVCSTISNVQHTKYSVILKGMAPPIFFTSTFVMFIHFVISQCYFFRHIRGFGKFYYSGAPYFPYYFHSNCLACASLFHTVNKLSAHPVGSSHLCGVSPEEKAIILDYQPPPSQPPPSQPPPFQPPSSQPSTFAQSLVQLLEMIIDCTFKIFL